MLNKPYVMVSVIEMNLVKTANVSFQPHTYIKYGATKGKRCYIYGTQPLILIVIGLLNILRIICEHNRFLLLYYVPSCIISYYLC